MNYKTDHRNQKSQVPNYEKMFINNANVIYLRIYRVIFLQQAGAQQT